MESNGNMLSKMIALDIAVNKLGISVDSVEMMKLVSVLEEINSTNKNQLFYEEDDYVQRA